MRRDISHWGSGGRGRLGLSREIEPIFWAMALVEGAFGAYMGIWPLWIERLGAPVGVVGLVLGASGIFRLFVLAPSAMLAERFGPRRLIVIARAIACLGMVSAALATHWTQLFGMVVAASFGELAFPLAQSYVAGRAGEERLRAFTLVFAVGPSVALALSPLISGALVAVWGMRAAFLLAALFTAASIFFFARIAGGQTGSTTNRPEPAARYRDAIGDVAVRRVLILQGATIFALALGTSFVPTFLADARDLNPARIATLGGLAAVGSALFSLVVTRTASLQRSPFFGAAIAIVVTVIGLNLFVETTATWLIPVAFICRGGFFSAWALYAGVIGEVAPARHRARAFALSEMIGGAAFSFAPMVGGQLYAVRPTLPFMLATVLSLALIPLLIRAQRAARLRPREGEQSEAKVVPEPEGAEVA